MAAARGKAGGLDALLDAADPEPRFAGPKSVPETEDPQFHASDAKMAVAPEPEPPEPVTPVTEPEAPPQLVPSGWYDVDGAPQDGKPVFLLGPDDPPDHADFPFVEAVWRNTRFYDKRGGRWQPTGFWAVRNCAGIKVGFDPIAWRPAQ